MDPLGEEVGGGRGKEAPPHILLIWQYPLCDLLAILSPDGGGGGGGVPALWLSEKLGEESLSGTDIVAKTPVLLLRRLLVLLVVVAARRPTPGPIRERLV
jgi:hypothetical protein